MSNGQGLRGGPASRPYEVARPQYSISGLLASLGGASFEGELSRLVTDMLGSNEMHIFRMPADRPAMIASISSDGTRAAERQSATYIEKRVWQYDPAMQSLAAETSSAPSIFRLNTGEPGSNELKSYYDAVDMRERVMVVGDGPEERMCLAVTRRGEAGHFRPEQEYRVPLLGELAFPLLMRHYSVAAEKRGLSQALTSLRLIERCLSLSGEIFPKREAEVAARIIYGLSAEGISLDLGIGIETVICYRRRFYQRFRISCFRELVVWYLELYGRVRGLAAEH